MSRSLSFAITMLKWVEENLLDFVQREHSFRSSDEAKTTQDVRELGDKTKREWEERERGKSACCSSRLQIALAGSSYISLRSTVYIPGRAAGRRKNPKLSVKDCCVGVLSYPTSNKDMSLSHLLSRVKKRKKNSYRVDPRSQYSQHRHSELPHYIAAAGHLELG